MLFQAPAVSQAHDSMTTWAVARIPSSNSMIYDFAAGEIIVTYDYNVYMS